MVGIPCTVRALRTALRNRTESPSSLAERALSRSNQSQSRNTYLWQDTTWTRSEAARVEATFQAESSIPFDESSPLWGLPVSVKDCFYLAGAPTTCGVRFYQNLNGVASKDSGIVAHLRDSGAVITGKTHLHPLAYGITGENPEFGDCLQPNDPSALTGGSSSGAAASIQEGSAVLAIGTDTGGSIRVPAALCGLAGYRATVGMGDWSGGAHLAESFDTIGCLFRDLEDASLLQHFFTAQNFFPAQTAAPAEGFRQFAMVDESFLHDCEPSIVESMHACSRELQSIGLRPARFDASWWDDSFNIFAPLQASEAARLHSGHFDHFENTIRKRLEWGASLRSNDIAALRRKHQVFCARMDELFSETTLLLLPAAPVTKLPAGADHSHTRTRLLRYTTPFSLSGCPVVTIPCKSGGMQLAAAKGFDASLLQFATRLGATRNVSRQS